MDVDGHETCTSSLTPMTTCFVMVRPGVTVGGDAGVFGRWCVCEGDSDLFQGPRQCSVCRGAELDCSKLSMDFAKRAFSNRIFFARTVCTIFQIPRLCFGFT